MAVRRRPAKVRILRPSHAPRTLTGIRCSDSARHASRWRTRSRRERWLASFPTNDPLAVHGEVAGRARPHRRADAHAARRSSSRRVFALDQQCAASCDAPDRAVHRAREAQQPRSRTSCGRRCSTSRRRSCSRTTRSRAKSRSTRRAHKWQQLLPELMCRQIVHWASTRRSGCTATSSGFPPSGRSCTRCSRSPARARSSARCCRSTRQQQHHDDRARVPARAAPAAHERRQHDRAPSRVGRAASSTNGAQPLRLVARAVVGDVVLRRPRRRARA